MNGLDSFGDGARVTFGLFDSDADVERSERCLPHWFQPGVAAFITFRTADSLPREVLQMWEREQREWLQARNINLAGVEGLSSIDLPDRSLHRRFQRYRHRRWNWHLDNCHGECVLRKPELAQIVANALLYFDGSRYDLDSFVVMPNHVHLLCQMLAAYELRHQCTGWLHYTATQINRALGRRGVFWQSEPFDHLVRTESQFQRLRNYIAANPRKAGLSRGEYIYWRRTA